MKVTDKLIKELEEKHGAIMVLDDEDGDRVVLSDPMLRLDYAKAIVGAAVEKGVQGMVDVLVKNCWLAGNEALKDDEEFKSGLEDEVKELIEIPDAKVTELAGGKAMISYNEHEIEINQPGRKQVIFAQKRNQGDIPFQTNIYLLEKVAISDLTELRKDIPAYLAVLVAVDKARKKKKVIVKKYSSRQRETCKKTTGSK